MTMLVLGIAAAVLVILGPLAAVVALRVRDRRLRRAGDAPVTGTLDRDSGLARFYRETWRYPGSAATGHGTDNWDNTAG